MSAATITPMATHPIDLALAERLHQLRKGLGLSVNDMAAHLGLWGANGADNLRQMERGARAVPGTLQVVIELMERMQALEHLEPENIRLQLEIWRLKDQARRTR